jgi:hypothetical protein
LEGEYELIVKFNPNSDQKMGIEGKLYCGKFGIPFQLVKQEVSSNTKKHFLKIHISNKEIDNVDYIELNAPNDPYNWIDYIYLAKLGTRGSFYSFAKHDKVRNILKILPGSIYRIKLEASKNKKWSGPSKVTLEGFSNDSEIISDDWIITGKKEEISKGMKLITTHEDQDMPMITQIHFHFEKKYNGFIEKVILEKGREVSSFEGVYKCVYEVVYDSSHIHPDDVENEKILSQIYTSNKQKQLTFNIRTD